MIIALILGLVLVAIPLYLWRRPRAEAIPVSTSTSSAAVGDAGSAGAVMTTSVAAVPELPKLAVVGDARVLSCHDAGPKKTHPENCDHLSEIEAALGKAIEETASCVPKEATGGTVQYVAEVNFKKKSIALFTPRDGRTLRNAKVVASCQAAVKAKVQAVSLEGVKHEHQRYRVAITATYPPRS